MNKKELTKIGFVYAGEIGTYSVYEYWTEDGIVALEAAVNNSDPELKIWIGKQGATFAKVDLGHTDTLVETQGRAKLIHDKSRIWGGSVRSFIRPRLVRFVTFLYVEKS